MDESTLDLVSTEGCVVTVPLEFARRSNLLREAADALSADYIPGMNISVPARTKSLQLIADLWAMQHKLRSFGHSSFSEAHAPEYDLPVLADLCLALRELDVPDLLEIFARRFVDLMTEHNTDMLEAVLGPCCYMKYGSYSA
eukprot:TRINITY_DN13758_c0_g1_i1.p1 TRINITY_DN13758_c0_g1~~TRINITY_DN13758_c0_g1_i1.p1  ORF type:complete len:142 (-),score=27.11 TRINITY_DN13758_c0_g1_i1:155-580(-)